MTALPHFHQVPDAFGPGSGLELASLLSLFENIEDDVRPARRRLTTHTQVLVK